MTIDGKGTARSATNILFTSTMSITSFTPTSGGYGTGQTVNVIGTGFGLGAAGSLAFLGDQPCIVQSSSYLALRCTTTPILTQRSVATFNAYEPAVLIGTP